MQLIGRIPGWPGVWHVTLGDGAIVRVERGSEATDARLPWITPGFFDLQVNGFGGFDVNAEDVTPETVRAMVRALWETGVTRVCPTVITGSHERLTRALRAVADACGDARVARSVPMIHLEGPYISPEDGPRGAHDATHVRDPDWAEFERLQDAAEGRIGVVTIAPEVHGAIGFVESLASRGLVPAIGHTAANGAHIRDAVLAGAKLSTHLGNGSHARLPRFPNYIWDQLAIDELHASFIMDGFHLPAEVAKTFLRAKGLARSILVTDAIAVAGRPPGDYLLAGLPIELTDAGKVRLKGTEYLAGSVLTMPRAIETTMRYASIGLHQAVALATLNPATVVGTQDRFGTIRAGADADIVEFDLEPSGEVVVQRTILGGEVVYRRRSA